jgi:hypothetical protein
MASGHVNHTYRPNTWLHRPSLRREDSLANRESSTHGTFAMCRRIRDLVAIRDSGRRADIAFLLQMTPELNSRRGRLFFGGLRAQLHDAVSAFTGSVN